MQIWCNAVDSNWETVGDGPVIVQSVSVRRQLDGAGNITMSLPLTQRAHTLMVADRRFIVYLEQNEGVRTFARGIVREAELNRSDGGRALEISAIDDLDELRRYSTWLNRIYDQQSIGTIASALAALAGWTATVDDDYTDELVDARFDGASVLKALQALAENNGLHLRAGTTTRSVEIGAFGGDAVVRLTNAPGVPYEAYDDDSVAYLGNISRSIDSDDLVNRLIPIGGGEGEAALTLESSTRSTPYTIQSTTIDGKTVYYLEDSASVLTYGVSEHVGSFKDIQPLANSSPSLIYAANALYDAAVAWLALRKDPLTTYDCDARKLKRLLRPGDTVHLQYLDVIEGDDGPFTVADVNEPLMLMAVSESATPNGITNTLSLHSVARYKRTAAEIIVAAIEDISLRNLKPQTYPFFSSDTYYDTIQGFGSATVNYKPAEFQIAIDDSVTYLTRCELRIRTHPPTTQAVGDTSMTTMFWSVYTASFHPRGLSIKINGTDYTSALSGPWGSGSAVDVTLDVTDILLTEGFRQDHDVKIEATETSISTPNGRISSSYSAIGGLECGNIELSVRVWGVAQSILPT